MVNNESLWHHLNQMFNKQKMLYLCGHLIHGKTTLVMRIFDVTAKMMLGMPTSYCSMSAFES